MCPRCHGSVLEYSIATTDEESVFNAYDLVNSRISQTPVVHVERCAADRRCAQVGGWPVKMAASKLSAGVMETQRGLPVEQRGRGRRAASGASLTLPVRGWKEPVMSMAFLQCRRTSAHQTGS